MAVAYSWNIFPPKSANVAASRPSQVRLPKGFAGSSMKRARLRLFHWTFSRWHKIVLQTPLTDAVVVTAYLTDKSKAEYGPVAHGSLAVGRIAGDTPATTERASCIVSRL